MARGRSGWKSNDFEATRVRSELALRLLMRQRSRPHVPGVTLHVRQRGNNRCAIFGDETDYASFLVMLHSATRRHRVDVHGYTLMTTHTHLYLTPTTAHGTAKAMHLLGLRYVMYFNRKYGRVGTLWTGPYRDKAITDERYWLTCLRYIELNPVRAKLVVRPEQYQWSSYRAHALDSRPSWLAPHPVFDALGADIDRRQAAYRALCAVPLTDEELARQRLGDLGQNGVRSGSDPSTFLDCVVSSSRRVAGGNGTDDPVS